MNLPSDQTRFQRTRDHGTEKGADGDICRPRNGTEKGADGDVCRPRNEGWSISVFLCLSILKYVKLVDRLSTHGIFAT